MRAVKYFYLNLFLLPMLFIGCEEVKNVLHKKSPRQKYVEALQKSPLSENNMVKRWIYSGDEALTDPVAVELPFQAKLVYFKDEINPRAWKFSLPEGRTLTAKVETLNSSHQLFIDLFAVENEGAKLKKSVEHSSISLTVDEPQTFILRIQPELLAAGSATLTVTDQPSMKFPVAGGDLNDVGGVYGDPRDGVGRIHKGVDIFAGRGTPVLAAAEGRVMQAGRSNGLGGITIWLRADGKAIYYAHLDSASAAEGQQVQQGDTLGFIGNSGNARTTPTHLHFGIYNDGAVKPLPFIKPANNQVEPVGVQPSTFPKWAVITAEKANVRPLPSTEKAPVETLTRHNTVKIIGGTGNWYHIQLPLGKEGFIFEDLLSPASSPLLSKKLQRNEPLYNKADYASLLLRTDSSITVGIYGHFRNWQLAKYRQHWVWVE